VANDEQREDPIPALEADMSAIGRRMADLTDEQAGRLFLHSHALDNLLAGIFNPAEQKAGKPAADTFRNYPRRLQAMAALRHVSGVNSTIGSDVGGRRIFLSPHHEQWIPDGFIFTEGEAPYVGLFELFRPADGSVSVAVSRRELVPGEEVDAQAAIEFLPLEVVQKWPQPVTPTTDADLDRPGAELDALLAARSNDEGAYQDLLSRHPWSLGLEYERIHRHAKLDEANVPDFMAVRVRDRNRDVVELKPPFMSIARDDGDWTSDFLRAWDQAERYLHFARTQRQYLKDKGLNFENPICLLVLGHDLDEPVLRRLRAKESMNPAIRVYTYNDLAAYIRNTVSVVRRMRQAGNPLNP
jgi:hypothetical protein